MTPWRVSILIEAISGTFMWCCCLIEIRIPGHQKVKSGIIFIAVNSIKCVFLSLYENVLNMEFSALVSCWFKEYCVLFQQGTGLS